MLVAFAAYDMLRPEVWPTLTLALARASSSRQVADVLGTHVLAAVGASGLTLGALSRDGEALEVLLTGNAPPALEDDCRTIPLASATPLTEVARSGRALWITALDALCDQYPLLAERAVATGNHAWAFVPLLVADQCIGALGFSFGRSRDFGPLERVQFEALASQCALVLSLSACRAELSAARVEADLATQVQRRVLQSVAHELRTPLTSLWGYARMARRALDESAPHIEIQRLRRAVDAVDRQAARLARLAAVIGDATLAEGGQLIVHPREVDLVPSLTRVVAATAADARPEQTIDLSAPETLRASVDLARFDQLVQLLLDNALHFTPPGGRIEVRLASAEDGSALLEIRDSGRGIPDQDREKAFAPFFQGRPASHAAGHTGLGLGLTVCRAIVEAHSGTIRLESPIEDSVGTRVRVTLPVSAGPTAELLRDGSDS